MEYNFIQTVAYMTGPTFKHIIDCVLLYFTNGFTNLFFKASIASGYNT